MQTPDLSVPTRQALVPSQAFAVLRSAAAAERTPLAAPQEALSSCLGAKEHAVDILRVQEICSFEACTRTSGAQSFVKGVVNLRGVILLIVDLRLKVGLGKAPTTSPTSRRWCKASFSACWFLSIEKLLSSAEMGLVDAAVQVH